MKKFLLLAFIVFSMDCLAQISGTLYVAAKGGLSLREKKDANSKVLVQIPYGTKVSINYPDEIVNITSDGIIGAWAKTSFNGKTGYIVNSFLLPWPPPKTTVKTMKQYLLQVSPAAGAPVIVKAGSIESLEAGGSNTKKQLYKNGAEYHEETFYEAGNDIYFLPGFTIEQGFILLRLLPEFKAVFGETDIFPMEDKTIKRGDDDYRIRVEKMEASDWIENIKIDYVEGAFYTFEMFLLGGQLVINFGAGV